jgi:hypothetical protein
MPVKNSEMDMQFQYKLDVLLTPVKISNALFNLISNFKGNSGQKSSDHD